MKKVLVLFLVLAVASGAYSAAVTQNQVKTTTQRAANGAESQNWAYALNWNGAVGVPANDTDIACNGVTLYGSAATSWDASGAVDAIQIKSGVVAESGQLRVGSNSPTTTGLPAALALYDGATLNIGNSYSPLHNSGFMSIGSDSAAAGSNGRNGLFYMYGGTLNALYGQGNIVVGNGNNNTLCANAGRMFMSGGTVNALNLIISRYVGSTGEVYVTGGTININTLSIRPNGTGGTQTAKLDVSGTGKVVINGDFVDQVKTYIDNGWIFSDGAEADYSIVSLVDGKTVIAVVPEPATVCLLGLGALSLLRRK